MNFKLASWNHQDKETQVTSKQIDFKSMSHQNDQNTEKNSRWGEIQVNSQNPEKAKPDTLRVLHVLKKQYQ